MFERTVTSFSELHLALEPYRTSRWVFRGQGDCAWSVVPKAGRPPFVGANDRVGFESWKRRAVEHLDFAPADDWEWLAVAQHHGLATRLLDWTFNPLIAAYFAVWGQEDAAACIYAFYPRLYVDRQERKSPFHDNPFGDDEVALFRPAIVARRIGHQQAAFSIQPDPAAPLSTQLADDQLLERIVIPVTYRERLLYELDHYGINQHVLFPGLDGLCAYTNWVTANRRNWTRPTRTDSVTQDALPNEPLNLTPGPGEVVLADAPPAHQPDGVYPP